MKKVTASVIQIIKNYSVNIKPKRIEIRRNMQNNTMKNDVLILVSDEFKLVSVTSVSVSERSTSLFRILFSDFFILTRVK